MRRPTLPSWMSRFKAGRKISCRNYCNSRVLPPHHGEPVALWNGSCRSAAGVPVALCVGPAPASPERAKARGSCRRAALVPPAQRKPGADLFATQSQGALDVTRFANRCGVTRANATGDSNDPLLSLLLHLGVALLFHAAFNVGRFIDLAVVPVHFHLAVRFALLHPVPQCAGCE